MLNVVHSTDAHVTFQESYKASNDYFVVVIVNLEFPSKVTWETMERAVYAVIYLEFILKFINSMYAT